MPDKYNNRLPYPKLFERKLPFTLVSWTDLRSIKVQSDLNVNAPMGTEIDPRSI